jgi:hypothetical protein
MNIAMTYAHSHKAVTTYTALLESDESPTSTHTMKCCKHGSKAKDIATERVPAPNQH